MEDAQYKNSEKVLETYIVKLNDKSEELECIITESHLVIEAEDAIRIPFSRIYDCDIYYPMVSDIGYSSSQPSESLLGTATLKYLDEVNKEKKLTLQMSAGSLSLFRQTLYRQMDKYEDPVTEKYRDKKKDSELALVGATILGCPLLWPLFPIFFFRKVMETNPTFAKAFIVTLIPIVILTTITGFQAEGLGYSTLGYTTFNVLMLYIAILIPTFIVFLILRKKQIAAGIILSFGISLPIAFVLLIIGL